MQQQLLTLILFTFTKHQWNDLSSKSTNWVSLTNSPPIPKPLDPMTKMPFPDLGHSQSHEIQWQKAISRSGPPPVGNGKHILKFLEPSTLSHSQSSISGSEAILAESPQMSLLCTSPCPSTFIGQFQETPFEVLPGTEPAQKIQVPSEVNKLSMITEGTRSRGPSKLF